MAEFSCELPRPKIACYKKVFANVKELQHELKERYWGEVLQVKIDSGLHVK
jgi:hypothetical protein